MPDPIKRKILDMVESGQISAEEGLRLINATQSTDPMPQKNAGETDSPDTFEVAEVDVLEPQRPQLSEEEQQRMTRLKRWWILPFGIGLLITAMGAIWMYIGYTSNGFGFGFWFSWILFMLGILILAISFQSSRGVWLHVRIKQKTGEKPQRVNISLPLPLSLTRWFISSFGDRIPGLKNQPVQEYSEILHNISPEEPFYVHIHEDGGEEVEVFIG